MRIFVVVFSLIPFLCVAQKKVIVEGLANRFDVYTQIAYVIALKEKQDLTIALGAGARSTFAVGTLHPSLNLRYRFRYFQKGAFHLNVGGNTFTSVLPVGNSNASIFNELGVHTGLQIGQTFTYHFNLGCSVGIEKFPLGNRSYFNAHLNMGIGYAF